MNLKCKRYTHFEVMLLLKFVSPQGVEVNVKGVSVKGVFIKGSHCEWQSLWRQASVKWRLPGHRSNHGQRSMPPRTETYTPGERDRPTPLHLHCPRKRPTPVRQRPTPLHWKSGGYVSYWNAFLFWLFSVLSYDAATANRMEEARAYGKASLFISTCGIGVGCLSILLLVILLTTRMASSDWRQGATLHNRFFSKFHWSFQQLV